MMNLQKAIRVMDISAGYPRFGYIVKIEWDSADVHFDNGGGAFNLPFSNLRELPWDYKGKEE